jgi:hypothetical protein
MAVNGNILAVLLSFMACVLQTSPEAVFLHDFVTKFYQTSDRRANIAGLTDIVYIWTFFK